MAAVKVNRPHIVGIGQAGIFVKSMLQGQELLLTAQVPFTKDGGSMASFFQYVRNGLFIFTEPVFTQGINTLKMPMRLE